MIYFTLICYSEPGEESVLVKVKRRETPAVQL